MARPAALRPFTARPPKERSPMKKLLHPSVCWSPRGHSHARRLRALLRQPRRQGDGSTWNYCGSDGYYQCDGDNCSWVSPTCPIRHRSGSTATSAPARPIAPPAATARTARAKRLASARTDADCGDGLPLRHGSQLVRAEPGQRLQRGLRLRQRCQQRATVSTGRTCTATCTCSNDAQRRQQGFGCCDETRSTCMPGQDPAGTLRWRDAHLHHARRRRARRARSR